MAKALFRMRSSNCGFYSSIRGVDLSHLGLKFDAVLDIVDAVQENDDELQLSRTSWIFWQGHP